MNDSRKQYDAVRRFNRTYTRKAGLLRRTLPGGPLPLAEARVLFELARSADGATAKDLADFLDMDKGRLSRILKRFRSQGLITASPHPQDGRAMVLRLAPKGVELLQRMEEAAREQAAAMLDGLGEAGITSVLEAMGVVERTLSGNGLQEDPVTLRTPEPGDLGWLLKRHGELYAAEYGFDSSFEEYVILGMADWLQGDRERSRVWIAAAGEERCGGMAMVANGDMAQLRWFLVDGWARGSGVGGLLLDAGLEFAREQGFGGVFLWTLQSLPAARKLYTRRHFTMTEEKQSVIWGQTLTEERWELDLAT